ncbi:MAG: SprT family zinc-dependent metalloprotease [Campylobacterota bacterium]|nr:SprT family zinc-dependent metalloprotease [Campylobacterota bacterium]
MSQQITLDNNTFTLIHRTNKKIKRISLAIENKDEIIIKTPLKFKVHRLKEIVYEYEDWILNSIKKVPFKNQFDFVSGGKIPFLGTQYPMRLKQNDKIKNVKFTFIDEQFIVEYNNETQSYDDFIGGLKTFYKHNAIKIIDPIFDEWTYKTQLFPNKIGYRFAKGRWGSCSYENNISINYKLLQFDIKCIEYVVLHELCHIEEKNHSKKFWNLVSSYMGDYKSVEKELRGKLF